ncbi:hypothetical protein RFN58_12490 [Streptomyces iakyrus]|uniref:hypothetical protein n=1 Tax=Streptomyces iakyrus TaxID=68219 RepID=UPI000524F71A|nr:hypothetical protein [Streptomyces iakyrus]
MVLAADLSLPVEADDERQVLLFGKDCDHPEREWCRAAFAAHAFDLRALLEEGTLPDGLISVDDRESLLRAVEPRRYPSRLPAGRAAAREKILRCLV